jgi:hypothetical protein
MRRSGDYVDSGEGWARPAGRGKAFVWLIRHTESQHLSVLLLRRLRRRATARPPAVIAQSVWIFDRWPARGISPRHRLWHWLMRDADMLTVLSPRNAEVARGIFPSTPVRFVKFGIRSDDLSEPRLPQSGAGPLRVLSLGNDKHRDWRTLVRATARDRRFDVRIVSHTASSLWSRAGKNIHVLRVKSNAELEELFRWADVIVVPLMPNLHASGITAIEEGVIRGVPRTELTRCKMRRSGDYVDSGEGWARPAGRGKAFVWLIRRRPSAKRWPFSNLGSWRRCGPFGGCDRAR